ncbi:hypothetical protein [Rubrivirga sp.]|uniref:hypothetical protein n=1 Tax=Rubrivirga sp. TaxID=1885344 RepID=UPI003C745AEB
MKRLAFLLALVSAGCEVPLDPIEQTDLVYSLSGYLDASADTQWVRVENVSTVAEVSPDALEADVVLTELGSGLEIVMQQKVQTFENGPAHLFWTTEDVELGGRYRLVAQRRADGAETTTTVSIPADGSFEVEVRDGRFTCPTSVTVRGADALADVQARYVVTGPRGRPFRFAYIDEVRDVEDVGFVGSVYPGEDATQMGIDPVTFAGLASAEIVVAVTTDDWPDLFRQTLEDALTVEGFGVENGLGFVGGVVTERRPFVPGINGSPFGPPPGPCRR